MFDLGRFRDAQERRQPGFAEALGELRAGRKTGHWIWYVFPQLRGLGTSPFAVKYGLDGVAEAEAYLREPVLAERLAAATAAVRAHVVDGGGGELAEVMGSDIDAAKVVSCLTLFGTLARGAPERDARPLFARLADDADAILAAAAEQGYPRCSFTARQLSARQ